MAAVFVLGVVLALGVAALIVHAVLTWADRRGWVYYRNPQRPPPRSLGILEEIYQPSVHHFIEETVSKQTEADSADSGAPLDPSRGDPLVGEPGDPLWGSSCWGTFSRRSSCWGTFREILLLGNLLEEIPLVGILCRDSASPEPGRTPFDERRRTLGEVFGSQEDALRVGFERQRLFERHR